MEKGDSKSTTNILILVPYIKMIIVPRNEESGSSVLDNQRP